MAITMVGSAAACGPTIEEEPPPELVDSRIEPCRMRCTIHLDPECGANPQDLAFRTVDECVDSCANVIGGWYWAPQEDGTDACAQEWAVAVECIVSLTCEEQHEFFTHQPLSSPDYPCREETEAKHRCFYSTPNLEREDD